ncbi:hypothetical protein A9B99_12545 [Mangrovibacter phragmitis]|uniref:Toxin VasX N-terminal region domain-containing protein n=1 Tax=Mangrovibacter phragmitis TaxID=1691903 RepID=A0A1B7L243_9ENTR|nr:T6SS effector BTH_I2691 family protein [Mangrovibacter phragmitis]OAT76255.1 hypothetical protein A9B99_12545 [Mangrovibacter phragmitis]
MEIVRQGCKFCIRYGLPVLPVRPAVMEKNDALPHLPENIFIPIQAQGDTAYTLRLMREGFLNIWHESGGRWINYYVTGEGYYYPLPEDGSVPEDIITGAREPCITQPQELATASLITLPVKPVGMKNGVFWFGWSEVEWTAATRKKHEDADFRRRVMQRFDMEEWLSAGKAEQTFSITRLVSSVAEYSSKIHASGHKKWSVAEVRQMRPLAGQYILDAAEALYQGKGCVVVLQDPVAVIQDISSLASYRLETQFTHNPEYSRGLALSASLSGLKDALTNQFERDQLTLGENMEQLALNGPAVKAGSMLPTMAGAQHSALYHHNNQSLQYQVAMWWGEYEKYIDREKEQAFLETYNAALSSYDEQIISPMVSMYLAWLKGPGLLNYLNGNFDSTDINSGALFTQTMMDCLQAMQDKPMVASWVQNQLSETTLSDSNILLRAAVMNNAAWSELVINITHANKDYSNVPWDKLIILYTSITDQSIGRVQLALEGYLNTVSGVLTGMLSRAADKILPCLVSLAASCGMGLKTVTSTGQRRHFIHAVIRQTGEMVDPDFRIPAHMMRQYVDIEVRRMTVNGLATEGVHQQKTLVLVDITELKHLQGGTVAASSRPVPLQSADEIRNTLYPPHWKNKLALAKRNLRRNFAHDGAQILPFAGSALAVVLQVSAVSFTASELMKGQLAGKEKATKFVADVVGAGGALLDMAERIIFNFKALRLTPLVRLHFGRVGLIKLASSLRFIIRICSAFSFITVFWDFYHGVSEFKRGNINLAIAYGISVIGGGSLVVSALFSQFALGPVGITIALGVLIGSSIYISLQNKDDIQKWLSACWWRKIPESESNVPEIWPTMEMEMAALEKLIKGS